MLWRKVKQGGGRGSYAPDRAVGEGQGNGTSGQKPEAEEMSHGHRAPGGRSSPAGPGAGADSRWPAEQGAEGMRSHEAHGPLEDEALTPGELAGL